MKKKFILAVLLMLALNPVSLKADQVDTYKKIQEWAPFFSESGKNIFFDSSYEYSFVSIGARRVHWKLLTSRLMYMVKGQIPYIEVSHHERDRVGDVTIAPGGYFQIGKTSLHLETGYGLDADYIYRFQTTAEVERPLYKSLNWNLGSRYLHYKSGDVFLIYPGLTYYFGNHYITANYGLSVTEGRGDAHWGTIKGNLYLHKKVSAYVGTAIGQRLFDIAPIEARKQGGFIIFTGLDFRLCENAKIRAGYSYSEERPNFIKRSIDAGLSVKF